MGLMGRETVIDDDVDQTLTLLRGVDGVDTEMSTSMGHGRTGEMIGTMIRVIVGITGGTERRGIESRTSLWRTSWLSWIELCVRFRCII